MSENKDKWNSWEVNEDDFEDTQDLTQVAAQVAAAETAEEAEELQEQGKTERQMDEPAERSAVLDLIDTGDWDEEVVIAATAAAIAADVREQHVEEKRSVEEKHSSQNRNSSRNTGSRKPANAGRRRRKKESGILAVWNGLHPMDRVVGITGIVVCLLAVVTMAFLFRDRSMTQQVSAFAEVGENLEQVSVADESVFLAVADGAIARQQAAAAVENETTEEESESAEEQENNEISIVEVEMRLTSIERDLKIKMVNKKTGKLVPGIPFEVEIKGPTSTITRVDEDKDGIIYLTSLKGGNFKVRLIGPKDLEGYQLPEVGETVTVKNEIEYKKIDVEEEIKTEAEINAAVEDTQIKQEVESVITDTVEWVESTKTAVGGEEYLEVKKSDIPDPSSTAGLPFAKFAGIKLAMAGDLLRTGGTVSGNEGGGDGGNGENSGENSGDQTVSVTGVSIEPSSASLTVGDTTKLSAMVSPDNATDKTVSWSSDNSGVASVAADGTVTAVAEGTATITVTTTDGGKTATASITVKAAKVNVTEVSISGGNSVEVGKTLTLTAAVLPENATDKTVSWSSDNTAVATVDGSGKVTGVSAGSANIKVTTTDGSKTAVAAVTVTAQKIAVTGVEISGADSVKVGETITLTAKVSPENATDKTVIWTSDNTSIATVDGNGKVSGVKTGSVTITAKAGEKTATKKVTVAAATVVLEKVTLDKTSVTLKVGNSLKLNAAVTPSGYTGCKWSSSDSSIVSVDDKGNIKALKVGKATITVCATEDSSKKATCEVTANSTGKTPQEDTTTVLKDGSGKQLYIKNSSGKYVAAVVADYYKYDKFYRKNENAQYLYTGWQNIDGKRYYYDKNGNKVTGEQVIQGVKYTFDGDGALSAGAALLGIDVSKHNGNINWAEVKNSGVNYVIIRCGYRGTATGVLVEDPKFRTNIEGALNAGLKVGIYFFSQAVNKVEAVEEASMTLALINQYKITYPVFLDVEAGGGRADGLSSAERTEVVNAYCQTIKNSGYTAGVYANKDWLNNKMNSGSFGSYKIWLAQYAAVPTYNGRYEMWQYSSTGRIGGISGNVDLNISYLGY